MAAFNRDSLRSSEAGLKYFVLGALSSGLLLYGLSLIYGFSGSLDFDRIGAVVEAGASPGLIAGMVFMLCGLGFKISAAPFHMWTPELSMFVGAIGALAQTNIKRLMAYSSIANMGYALVPLSAGGAAGVKGMLIFMSIYVITVIGIFACILQMRIRNGMVEKISDLSGLSKSNKGLAIVLTMFMFSVMGIPPLLGFWGKLFAFLPAVEAGLVWLVVLALVASVIGAFYYLRIIKSMWFDEAAHEFVEAPSSLRWISIGSAVLILPLLILPFTAIPATGFISQAAASLF